MGNGQIGPVQDKVGEEKETKRIGTAERDLIALGIAAAAIILFVGTGGSVLPRVLDAFMGNGQNPDKLLVNALLLNIALVIFGWRRYRQLTDEIEHRRAAEEQARELAEIDPLSGCLNRRSMETATEELRLRSNAQGQALAYVMIDLDNFKQINDMHGHSVGDQVLTELADRIHARLPKSALLARLGGDEFAFVVPFEPDRPDRVDKQVSSLVQSMVTPFKVDELAIDVTMSIGIASDHEKTNFDPETSNAETLMHRADIAMYQAKKHGKNRHFWFEPSMEDELRFRNELETGIRRGLQRHEFVPYYEQQVDLATGELVGFEMLARWESPQLGLVSPETFIPIAEDIGLIGHLSEMLIEQAFVDANDWDPELTLSVNISPVQLRDPWFAQKLIKLIVQHNFNANRLEIEITESCLHDNVGMVRSMITSLRNQGVKVSLDDFGTGYSSLEQLRTLPFDRLKIDRTFINELRDPEAGTKIVDAIVSLGKGLDMPITAEGIEDQQMLDTLKAMGKLKGQGYFYGRPESSSDVRRRLQAMGRLMERETPASDDASDELDLRKSPKTATQ